MGSLQLALHRLYGSGFIEARSHHKSRQMTAGTNRLPKRCRNREVKISLVHAIQPHASNVLDDANHHTAKVARDTIAGAKNELLAEGVFSRPEPLCRGLADDSRNAFEIHAVPQL